MEYRPLGNSGLKVSEVAIGAWLTYGGTVEDDDAERCLRKALDLGVNFIDVADVYSRGEAERVVGQTISDLDRSNLVLSSKVYWPLSDDVNDRGLSRKHIMESIEGSLRRLGTDYLDLYFCHRYDEDTPLEETIRAMDDLVHQGKVLYWGTSVWSADQIDDAVTICNDGGYYRPQCEQPRYNLIDRSIEGGVMPTVVSHGMGLVVWSPLAQGLLTGKYNLGTPEGSHRAGSGWLDSDLNEPNLEKVKRLIQLASDLGITTAQLALIWILRHDAVSSVIVGATRPEHVVDNVGASEARAKVPDDVLETLDQIFT
jgi:voltage-dependent potassium channel beta subunit